MNNTRKWRVLLIVISITVLISSCTKSPDNQLIGEWRGTDQAGTTAALTFYEDGTVRMIRNGASVEGTITWKLDASRDPMHLDVVFSRESGEPIIHPMIMRFLEENRLQLEGGEYNHTRPLEFSEPPNRNQIVLTRQ